MTPFAGDPPTDELVALYFAGALPADEARAFEDRLAAGWPEAEAAIRDAEAAVRNLVEDVPPVSPPTRLKADLLARLPDPATPRAADRAAARALPAVLFRFAEDGVFEPLPFPGVSMRLLHIDHARRQFSCLLKMEPGSVLPAHPHEGPEECLVLDGELIVDGVRMRKGDYQRSEGGTRHVEQRTDVGAVAFLSVPLALLAH